MSGLPLLSDLKEKCLKIHYFGLGFIQLKCKNPKWRYHFYTKAFPSIMPQEELHNHRYEFRSKVIKGSLSNHIYAVCSGNEYEKVRVSCDPKLPVTDATTEWVGAYPLVRTHMAAESVYTQRPEAFHRVIPHGDTITLIERPSEEEHYAPFAEVLRKLNSPKVCPFSMKIPEDQLWAEVEKMLSE